ncbi:hypothetical protein SMA5143A_7434 [Streptomyces sp. MA5143a]|nr:hypothetical protein SMA5143A_7434 [Streptomyces sp. MA5143a]
MRHPLVPACARPASSIMPRGGRAKKVEAGIGRGEM